MSGLAVLYYSQTKSSYTQSLFLYHLRSRRIRNEPIPLRNIPKKQARGRNREGSKIDIGRVAQARNPVQSASPSRIFKTERWFQITSRHRGFFKTPKERRYVEKGEESCKVYYPRTAVLPPTTPS